MRALLSVYDKTGIVEFAKALHELGVELVSSGGTAREIANANIAVTDVAEITGFPAMLGHRVVTLHPLVHGGILADRNDPDHQADIAKYSIPLFDLVVANLYPFGSDPSIDLIDIGGPAMVRASAKNHQFVGIVVDPADYAPVLGDISTTGGLSDQLRLRLAAKAFAHTAAYDAAVRDWFAVQLDSGDSEKDNVSTVDAGEQLPATLNLTATRREVLRYGENPHQHGARYSTGDSCWDTATLLQGKPMSYLNVYDADAAWKLVWQLSDSSPAAVVIKHANPCGAAVAETIELAYRRAHAGDPVSAYGGIVALNRPMSVEVATELVSVFTEVVIAPGFDAAALEVLATKENLRVIETVPPVGNLLDVRTIDGGLLVQTADTVSTDRSKWNVVTKRQPSDSEWEDLELAWRIVARVTSNTIVLVNDGQAVGIGAGQQNRRDAGRLAGDKAAGRAAGGACASDAFFPFRDGLDAAIAAGATAVIQPGGSIRDDEVIAAADEAGLAMVFTSERHFKH